MLLSRHSNAELRELFDQATRTESAEKLEQLFGKPPYPFFGVRSGPEPRYSDFVPQYEDAAGRQYRLIEDGAFLAIRIPIKLRRANPAIDWPQELSTLTLKPVEAGLEEFSVRVVSFQQNRTRHSTAKIEFSRID